ncbi:aconitate hydratase [Brachyspira aalborgi]|uniref:Aconitate hydratase A n=1 Tax=Brachyspira aalborgi TaxID=29522 RepID=A0AB38Q0R8_9SPIR|nr:aconitate hydratase [Brachyspira aalborgi]MBS4763424.1 aconitate hydratase [Brachyspira sp.]CCY75629.1 aconitate hydratase [Brachyspira sp. CAG:700]TXJ14720.1 aconitate hydratase [Brachyspira aalborgi]TXJ18646.1 aconitate hydratase [Brachyspira aalborgi]TXJ24552.1 aconitate hydratase [Brachyspira aalborgi]
MKIYDIEMIREFYKNYSSKIERIREKIKKPLTLSEKILFAHLYNENDIRDFKRSEDYANFKPDRVAMQDATAQMTLLQFMNAGKESSNVPATIHCDHLIQAYKGAEEDLKNAININKEVYDFLQSVAKKYGLGFWEAGSGIIHQIVLENYAFPGGIMIGTDSHTPNAGGLGMMAIGVGGADAVDVMTGMEWELKIPNLIGVKLTGELNGWASAKDVILKLAGILTVKGATNCIIEYFGEGALNLSAVGKSSICNMGAEVGATTSIFPFDNNIKEYLIRTGREEVAKLSEENSNNLKADEEVYKNPSKFYDKIIEINLSELEPYINGPFTPDSASKISDFAKKVEENKYPEKMEVGLIGSCTNSSYYDLSKAASIARQVKEKKLKVKSQIIINPGSLNSYNAALKEGIIDDFKNINAIIMTNACGPCIGQWKRITDDNNKVNSIVTSFNRNFAKRADGNPNTHAFIASPEIVMALSIAGDLKFNPLKDYLINEDGEKVKLDIPTGEIFPKNGLNIENAENENRENIADSKVEIIINKDSNRLQLLKPFPKFNEEDFNNMPLLIKAKGKCTTDHISMAGVWLKFRGHLENISDNMLMGAVNYFNDKTNCVFNQLSGNYEEVSKVAKEYKLNNISSIVVAEENYGEGSSREHAAMEPRFLNVKVILVKSFARIHETNLKKQGMLAITFKDKNDYYKIKEKDKISIENIESFSPNKSLLIKAVGEDKKEIYFEALHTYNDTQIEWFKNGRALNTLLKK